MRPIRSVVFDVDSTLTGLEGVDWLAAQRGEAVAADVASLTDRAMAGEMPLEAVYGRRLAMIAPHATELAALVEAYATAVAPGAAEAVASLRAAGVRVVAVSGGLLPAVRPFCAALGLAADDVHAVDLRFAADGRYVGFDEASPLTTADGKRRLVAGLALPHRILAVGDGNTDAAMRPAVDVFAAYTGFVRRAPVVAAADFSVDGMTAIVDFVLEGSQ